MRKTTYDELRADEIRALSGLHWELTLEALEPPAVEEDDPLRIRLPYFPAFLAYEQHVEGCEECQTTPVWDIGCERGARLAHESAQAMGRQDVMAARN